MEFPELGSNCSKESCKRLDFLPIKCDKCKKLFCTNHFKYSHHDCIVVSGDDFQVPVCPLCGEPVPTPPGVSPDQTVGQHIDQSCKSERKRIFTNRCSYKNCKKRELIPLQCSSCKMNFCLRHRHTADHECSGSYSSSSSRKTLGKSKQAEVTKTVNTRSFAETVQGNMTEDEALAKALALSMSESTNTNQLVDPGSTSNKEKCRLS